jgi:hypothetical protein
MWNLILKGHSGFVATDLHFLGKLGGKVDELVSAVNAVQVGGVDLDALATKVAALLPAPPTAVEVAEELAKRLGNG